MNRCRYLGIVLLSGLLSAVVFASPKQDLLNGNYRQAFLTFSEQSNAGDIEADYWLGYCYQNGLGTEKSLTQALRFYQRAAENKMPRAQFELGKLLEDNDPAASQRWLREAANAGVYGAEQLLLLNASSKNTHALESSDLPPLHSAILRGDEAQFRAFLSKERVIQRDDAERTALHWAAQQGELAMITPLLDAGANPNAVDVAFLTPLDLTAKGSPIEAILTRVGAKRGKQLRPQRVDPWHYPSNANIGRPGAFQAWPDLHRAAWSGDLTRVKSLLAAGETTTMIDAQGFTPLQRAIQNNQSAVVNYLLQQPTPSPWSASSAEEVLIAILQRKANPWLSQSLDLISLQGLMLDWGKIFKHSIETIEASSWSELMTLDTVKVALGSDQNLVARLVASAPESILEQWVRGQNPPAAKALFKLAIRHGRVSLVEALLRDRSPDLGEMSKDEPLLHLAIKRDHNSIAILLIENGVPINLQNSRGNTALGLAAERNNGLVVDALLAKGADTELRNNHSFTALHLAVMADADTAVTHLLAAGANPRRRDSEGRSAEELAHQFAALKSAVALKQ